MPQEDELEIAIEEWGEHSWLKALINTLSGTAGSAQFRFVARPPGEHREPAQDRFVGATFPVMRFQDLDNTAEPNAWMDIIRERLDEMHHQLLGEGWHRVEGKGSHWWSNRYTRS